LKDQEQAYNLRRMVGFGAAAMADAPHGGMSEPEEDTEEPMMPNFDWAKKLGWDWDAIKKNLKIPTTTDEAKPEDVVIPAGGVHPGIIGGDADTQKAAAKATSQQRLPTIIPYNKKENDEFEKAKTINYPEPNTASWANPNSNKPESKETGWMLSTPAQLAAQREKATPEQRKQVEDSASKLGVEPWSQEHLDAAQKSATKNPAATPNRTATQTTSGRETGMGQGKTAVQPTRTWDEVAAEHIPERFKDLPVTRKDGKVYAGDVEMTAASQETENYASDAPSRKQLQEKLVVNQYCNFLSEMAKPKKQKETSAGSDLFGSTETPTPKPSEKPATKATTKPVAEKPVTKPAAEKPATKPATKPVKTEEKPVAKRATRKPATKPGTTYKLEGDAPSVFAPTSQSYPFNREVSIPQGEKQLANYLGVHQPFGFNQQTSNPSTPKSSTTKTVTGVKRRDTGDNFSHLKDTIMFTVGGPEQSVTPPPPKEPLAKRAVGAVKRNPAATGVAALGLAGLLAIANNARTSQQQTPQPKTQVQDVVNTQDTPSKSPWGTPSAPKTEPNKNSGNFKPLPWTNKIKK
jgi:hypothetical protein